MILLAQLLRVLPELKTNLVTEENLGSSLVKESCFQQSQMFYLFAENLHQY